MRFLAVAFAFGVLGYAGCAADAAQEPEAEAPSTQNQQELTSVGRRVCSWNIRRLGHAFDDRAKDMTATKNIVNDFCDVVAVQEVMQTTGGGTPGFDQLLARLGEKWDGVRTEGPRPNTTSSNSEHYAFFWRKSAAQLCDGWSGTRYLPDDEDAFLREPAWACIKLAAYDRELILASYHAIYGTVTERRREVALIDDDLDNDGKKDDVFRTMQGSRPGNPAVLFLGDFNLTPREMADALPTYKDLTDGEGSTINAEDGITANQYDHLVVASDDPIVADLKPAKTLDVRHRAKNDTFFRSISDHLPIRFVVAPSNATN